MEKVVYIVNHGETEGYGAHDELTARGIVHAEELGEFLLGFSIDRVISSPLLRARQTAGLIADKIGVHLEEDSRLTEHKMSARMADNWLLEVEDPYLDLHLSQEEGESSEDAVQNATEVINELKPGTQTVLVTHSLLLILLLRNFTDQIGFEDWQSLKHPDVYELRINGNRANVTHIWKTS